MTRRALVPLAGLSQLILDRKLADLERAARACAESRERLADLTIPPFQTDLPLPAAAQAALLYDRWAEARRAEINQTLARQTAGWIEAREAAATAFGRAEVLRKLTERG